MSKHSLSYLLAAGLLLCGCKNDDTDFSAYTSGSGDGTVTTIYIDYSGTSATVSGDSQGVVSVSGAHVRVVSQAADSLLLVLSGSTTDGSLLVSRNSSYGILLNAVSITNPAGAAINNQGKKSLYVACADGTTNTLVDGTTYTAQDFDQKATLFSEGDLYLCGAGTLNVTANHQNAIASDDKLVIADDVVVNTTTAATGSNGLKANDGVYINGGTTTIDVLSDAGRGIKCDSTMFINGGTTAITTAGACTFTTTDGTVITESQRPEYTDEQVADTTSAACIKSDGKLTMTGGSLTCTSTGSGGKGINCSADVVVSGGTLNVTTTGDNTYSKPKGVKSDTAIIVSGGSFKVSVSKSWACDNGYEDDTLSDAELALRRITVEGTPSTSSIGKKYVYIVY